MKKNLIVWALFASIALLLLCGCRHDVPPSDTTVETEAPATDPSEGTVAPEPADTTTDAETTEPAPSPVETEAPETESPVLLYAHTLTATDAGVALRYEASVQDTQGAWSLVFTLADGAGVIHEATAAIPAGMADITLPCAADRLSGELTLTVKALAGQTVGDTMILRMKDQLPQLTADGVRCVLAAMTDEEKAHLVAGVTEPAKKGVSGETYPIPRLGVPAITVNDGPAGVRYGTAVWYPAVINLSSSWDPSVALRVGQSIGEDSLALGIDIVLGPGMNIQKNVLGGRNFEYSSEDPILTALMVAPYVEGIQASGAGACIKHFAANNQETARGGGSSNVTERALREIYLRAFGMVIADVDPMTVMSSYNRINGTQTAASRDLLTDILRGEFGFDGFVMSDWGAAGTMVEKVNAGNDINMPGGDNDANEVLAGIRNGQISETAINACCYNLLSVITETATFRGLEMNTRVDGLAHHELAAIEAADTFVLLSNNEATLPLSSGTKIAVFGNGAYKTVFGGAGSGSVTPFRAVSIMEGLTKAAGLTVVNEEGNPFEKCDYHSADDPTKDIPVTEAYAATCADAADVAVIVISRGSTEGADRSTLQGDFLLNDTEREMLERVSAAFRAKGKRVVVLLNIGSPMEVVSWQAMADALLWIGYPGEGAGTAVARVLTGEVNPSGKTTITWPTSYASTPASQHFPGSASSVVYYEDIYVGYRYYSTFHVDVAYPFGYGLSYTTFSYSDFRIEREGDTLLATVTVRNTGATAGREIAELYVSKPETLREQAAIELVGFGKTALLAPGESETLTIRVSIEALSVYDTEGSRWVIDKGEHVFRVGSSSATLLLQASLTLVTDAPLVLQDVENECVPITAFDYIQKATYTVPDMEADGRINLALGKPAWSNFDEGSYTPDKAVDGDFITRWSGLGLSTGLSHDWGVDLGAEYALGEVDILFESIHAPYTILISSDGQNYTRCGTYIDDGSMRADLNLHGAKARYIKLEILRSSQAMSIFEIMIYEATPADLEAGEDKPVRENLAQGKPVTATDHEGDYVKEHIVDGDIATRWGSLPSGEAWIRIDLTSVQSITAIELYMEAAWVPYLIEYSTDGETYKTLYSGKKDELFVVLDNLDVEARYIRVKRDGSNWFSIYELYVYGA